jgi:hypothetical protein
MLKIKYGKRTQEDDGQSNKHQLKNSFSIKAVNKFNKHRIDLLFVSSFDRKATPLDGEPQITNW